jgi:sigma-E factor negative regulatory protein RseB
MASLAEMLRHDDDMYTFVPERHLVVVEKRQNKDAFPALLTTGSDQVLTVYEPKMLGPDRVAGIDSQVIELDPKDAWRFAYKLWADSKTGLLLRAQTLGPDGQVLEQLSFSQVQIGGSVDRAGIANGIKNLAGWTVVRPPVEPVDMAAQGWKITPAVPGFREIRELRRPMASREEGQPPIPVDQAVFSDGLAAISIFVEPVEKNSRKEGCWRQRRHTRAGQAPRGFLDYLAGRSAPGHVAAICFCHRIQAFQVIPRPTKI